MTAVHAVTFVIGEVMFDIQEELKKLPRCPGVYIMHDEADTIIYVGKAVNLHNRVRSYFRKNIGRGPQIDKMVTLINRFEYIVTDSELEALVLENNLIKEHRPKYNTMLKDDKTYPYLKITLNEKYPRIITTRRLIKDGSRYFGPYTSSTAMKETLNLLRKLFPLRTCKYLADRPCLEYHIKRCLAPCANYIDEDTYKDMVDGVCLFLEGKSEVVEQNLAKKMQMAAQNLDFEKAARLRDQLLAVRKIMEKQKKKK